MGVCEGQGNGIDDDRKVTTCQKGIILCQIYQNTAAYIQLSKEGFKNNKKQITKYSKNTRQRDNVFQHLNSAARNPYKRNVFQHYLNSAARNPHKQYNVVITRQPHCLLWPATPATLTGSNTDDGPRRNGAACLGGITPGGYRFTSFTTASTRPSTFISGTHIIDLIVFRLSGPPLPLCKLPSKQVSDPRFDATNAPSSVSNGWMNPSSALGDNAAVWIFLERKQEERIGSSRESLVPLTLYCERGRDKNNWG